MPQQVRHTLQMDTRIHLPFTIGVVIASAVWHSMLALLAGTLGRRVAESGHRRLIRISSVALGIVGVVLVA